MALFYSEKSPQSAAKKTAKTAAKSTACPVFHIQDLDYQGLGVAKVQGKTWFVENALPNEQVEVRILEEKRQYGRAQAVRWRVKSAERQTPACPIFDQCGGCQMQHLPIERQRAAKQQALFHRLQRLQTAPIDLQPMIAGQAFGYRRRAKLHILWQNNRLTIGFRQAHSQKVIDVAQCAVLEPALSALLPELPPLFAQWRQKKALGHLELVRADNGVALLLRHLGKLHQLDEQALRQFAEQHNLLLFVMTEKDQIEQWRGEVPFYQIGDLRLHFSIRDFIQINAELNVKMVQQAMAWLALTPQDRVLDLFCGMGNFTLPIAEKVAQAVGIEGVAEMVAQAERNAASNGLENVAFYQTDLDQPFVNQPWAADHFNKVLLDPARNGARFALDHLCQLAPERLVYISCNPATLVRDSEQLIKQGYRLEKCAMIDMFPHTGHLESMVLFVKS